jgi:hypothetical protein
MSKSLRTTVLPPSPASGAVTWEGLRGYLAAYQREVLAALDVRSDINDFAGGLYQAGDGRLIVGADAGLAGRPSSSLPTVLTRITDGGRAEDQRFLPQVSAGNVLSMQDAGPVTAEATAGPGNAEITIAAHTLQYGWGAVSYNAGSIAGLDPDTNYYVYADDPDYLGGAVTYLATTNRQTVTASNGRYFVGAVRTTVALTTANISAATSTNPVQFTTSAAHGWNTGNTVDFASLPGNFGTAFNNGVFQITVNGASTFTVAVDGSAFSAYTSGGTVTRTNVTSISGNGGGGGWVDDAFRVQF